MIRDDATRDAAHVSPFRLYGIAGLVFVAALLPRLYALGTFLTIDEVKWAEGAAQFLLALQSGDLAQTYWHFHPGITITWGSALALGIRCLPAPDMARCATSQVENLAGSIGWLRLSPVLLTSVGVAGVYVLGRKLLGDGLALLTALLLAFDPFFIAHSRILNGDAGAAILMFLSLLAFLGYWLGPATNGDGRRVTDDRRQMTACPGTEGRRGDRRPATGDEYEETSAKDKVKASSAQPIPHTSDPSSVAPRSPLPAPRSPLSAPRSSLLAPRSPLLLIISGVLAGLALLTKLPAPLIGLFVGGLGLVAILKDIRQPGAERQPIHVIIRHWIAVLLVWGGVALLTFGLLWPALWVAPVETLRQMYVDTFEIGQASEGHAAFFRGEIVTDPGPWFYPYAVAFRLTPIVMVGLIAAMGWLLSGIWQTIHSKSPISNLQSPISNPKSAVRSPQSAILFALVMLAYIIFIILFANLSPKKLDRYVMAVVPPVMFLAALGFMKVWPWGTGVVERRAAFRVGSSAGRFPAVLLAAVVAFHLVFAVLAAPYYLTYYNPLLGGVEQAAKQTPVGWGEGLERAATYLNGLPEADSLAVSSWYSDIFQPYFEGQRASFSDDGRAQLASDYVVFYVNQIQRQTPYAGLVDYFRSHEPVFVVAIDPWGRPVSLARGERASRAVPWVEVYQAPAAQSAGGAPEVEGVARLLAYKVTGKRVADSRNGIDGDDETASITLFFEVLGPLPEETTFGVRLVPAATGAKILSDSRLLPVRQATTVKGDWIAGQIVEWRETLTVSPDMPAGEYRLWVAFQFADGTVIGEFPLSEKDPPIVVREGS